MTNRSSTQSNQPNEHELLTSIGVLEKLAKTDPTVGPALETLRSLLRGLLENEQQVMTPEDRRRIEASGKWKNLCTVLEQVVADPNLQNDGKYVRSKLREFVEAYHDCMARGVTAQKMMKYTSMPPYEAPDHSWRVDLICSGGGPPYVILYKENDQWEEI